VAQSSPPGAWNPNYPAASALLALALLAAFAPSLFMPIAAAAFLYLVPGFLLEKLLRLELGGVQSAAFSVLASIMVSAYAIYWLSILLGYGTGAFYAFFLLCALAALFLPPIALPSAITFARGDLAAPLVAGFAALAVFSILYVSLWVPSETGIIVGGWNYGDFFLHASVIQSVNHGNFPPQEPIYAGVPLAYHWFIDLHTAIASKLLSGELRLPAIADSALSVGLLSLFTFFLAERFTRDRKAAAIAALLIVFAGSFAWLNVFDLLSAQQAAAGAPAAQHFVLENTSTWNSPLAQAGSLASNSTPLFSVLNRTAVDNDWKYFQLPSMLPGFLLSQRPLAVGLAAFAGILLLIATGYPNDWRRLLLAGILLGMLPPFHYYAFLAAALCAALYFAVFHAPSWYRVPGRVWRLLRANPPWTWAEDVIGLRISSEGIRLWFSSEAVRQEFMAALPVLTVIVPSFLLAFPFLLSAAGRAGGMLKALPFWVVPDALKGLNIIPKEGPVDPLAFAAEFVKFYLANLGPVPLIALAGVLLLAWRAKKSGWKEPGPLAFLALSALLLFAIPNLVSFSNTDWDMGKFFMLMLVPVCILASVAVARVPFAWPLIVAACCITPLFASIFYVTCGWHGLYNDDLAAGKWILDSTPERAVFASSTDHNTPIDSVAGRLRILGYQSWVENYGLNYSARYADLVQLYCGPREGAAAIMEKYNATYAYVSRREARMYGCNPQFDGLIGFTKKYDADGIMIYAFNASGGM